MLFRIGRVLLFYGAIIGVWQVIAMAEVWPSYLFPSPVAVFDALWSNIRSGTIVQALGISMQRLAVGYALSFVIGMSIGLVIGTVRWADETFGTIVLGLQSLPSITWLPLAVLWIGLNEQAIIFVVLMGSLFSIAISARSGVQGVPVLMRRAAQTFGASRWQMYRYVVIPAMLPAIVQGLKLGWSFAWRSLMAGELLFVSLGLGHLLNLGRDLNDISLVAAVMLVIIAVGLSVDRLIFGRIESVLHERWGLATS